MGTWSAQSWIEGGAGSFTTLSGVTEEFSADVDLVTGGDILADVMVEVEFDSSPTDDVEVAFYGSQDGTNYDDVAFSKIVIDNGTDPAQLTFTIIGKSHFRVGFKQTGSTDSHDVRASYRAYSP